MAPRTTKQFNELRAASMKNIVQAALKLFSTVGYLNVSVSDIASEAGISQGLMYNYFKSKEKLLIHIMDSMMAEMQEFMDKIEVPPSPSVKLQIAIESFFTLIVMRKEFWSMMLPIVTQRSVSAKVGTPMSDFFSSAITALQAIFKELDVDDPKEEAFKLGAILDGIAWHYFYIFKDKYPLKKMQKKILKDYDYLINPKKK